MSFKPYTQLPAVDAPTKCEENLMRWWGSASASNHPNKSPALAWSQVSDWCHGAAVGSEAFSDAQLAYSLANSLAWEHARSALPSG